MINPKWLFGLFLLYILLMIGAGAVEQQYLLAGEASTFQILMDGNILEKWQAFNTILWFDFPFFHSEWSAIRIVLVAMSGSILLVVVITIAQSVLSVVRRFTGGVG